MSDKVEAKPRWSVAPYFIVDDVVATANYYRDQLGFHYERFWGEPACFCMVKRNGIVIMLAQFEKSGGTACRALPRKTLRFVVRCRVSFR